MITTPKHTISLVCDGTQVRDWDSYRITTSMTDGVEQFEMRMSLDKADRAWRVCAPARPVLFLVDDTPVLTGFIDDSDVPEDDPNVLEVKGRSKLGWLHHDCPPGINFAGLGMKDLITKLATPVFSEVTFDNARNRTVVRGRGGKKARAGSEPLKISTPKKVGTRIEPGKTRLAVIASLCEQAGLVFFSSGDGRQLVVTQPNYDQEPQFRFFRPVGGSPRANEATVKALGIHRSAADLYSRVICVGSGAGTDANYGATCASRYGESRAAMYDFPIEKTLIVQRQVNSAAEAKEFAEAEMARRNSQGLVLTARAAGHGQLIAGSRKTLFANDLIAIVEDERRPELDGRYLIVSTEFVSGRGAGEEATVKLVPKGTVLR